MFRIVVFAALVFRAAFPPVRAQEAGVIASMDEMRFAPPKEKGSASLVDGRVGKVVRFRFTAGKNNPNPLFVHDRVHLSKAGHALVAETVLKAIEQKQKETVTTRSPTP